jgi:hypothetical protein
MNELPWKDPSLERPNMGDKVWILERHWKAQFPESYTISAGEVGRDNMSNLCVSNGDDAGRGWQTWDWKNDVDAWLPADAIPLPKWVTK